MSFLDQIDQDNRNVIVALPYRVGLWMSHIDDAGGDEADDEEMQALESILDGFTREVFGSEVVQIVMTENMKRKDEWRGAWSDNLEQVPDECQKALDALRDAGVEVKEISAYKQRLIEIAEAVALAFREYDQMSFINKLRMYLLFYRERYKALKKGMSFKTMDQFLNISLLERKGLYKLSHVLDVPYM